MVRHHGTPRFPVRSGALDLTGEEEPGSGSAAEWNEGYEDPGPPDPDQLCFTAGPGRCTHRRGMKG